MAESDFFYSLAYVVLAALVVAPPTEFISAGLTVQNLLAKWLGSEQMNFIEYHQRRTTATMLVHSLLPLGYYVGRLFVNSQSGVSLHHVIPTSFYWRLFLLAALILPFSIFILAAFWKYDKWRMHPLTKCLTSLAPTGSSWRAVASSINMEFRRVDKFTTGLPGRRLIVTDSWLILTSTYHVRVAYQRDIHLTLLGSDEHAVHYESSTGAQFLNLLVSGVNTKPFHIRLNAAEYSDLRDKLRSPIINVRNVVIRQSLSDRFLDAFRAQVNLNGTFRRPPDMELEQCIGCMQVDSNVKLQKLCADISEGQCLQCFCRPMWCLECMGKWFASRQDQSQPETWLASRSPCPTCRATFCMLDVCKIV